jgi:benzylsuccinate CoA-transferase BbsF subunit
MSGLMSITGYPGDWPDFSGPNLPDFLTPYSAVGLTVAALLYRRRTGKGVWIDLAQRELAVAAIGDVVMDYSMNQRVLQPMANRHSRYAPHGVFRCAGDDRWVALAVRDDAEWGRLCSVIGRPDLGHDPRFATAEARRQNQDELTPFIEGWTSLRSPTAAMEEMQLQGIPAGAVLKAGDLYRDPHLRERGFYDTVDDPDGGTFEYPGRPWKFSRSSVDHRSSAPRFGEDTRYICQDILGIPEAHLTTLVERGVLAREPSVIYQAVPKGESA